MKRHLLIIATLLGLSAAVQAWCIGHAVVPAQDVVRLASAAAAIEHDGLPAMLAEYAEPPLFPAAACLTHATLHPWLIDRPCDWAVSAQITAAAALVLTVVPLYGFLLYLVRRRAAAVGAMWFCLIPVAARLGADGLGDSTHLLLFTTALWGVARYLRCGSPTWLLLTGAALAAAALAGKEALILAPVIVFALWLFQCRAAWRQSWARLGISGICLALGMAVVLGPVLLANGAATPRHAAAALLGRPIDDPSASSVKTTGTKRKRRRVSRWRTSDGQRMAFDKKDAGASLRFHGYPAAVREYGRELAKTFHYWFGALALGSLWVTRRRVRRPVDAFTALLFVIYSLAAVHMAARSGYLAPRHLLPLLVLGIGWSGKGTIQLGRLLRRVVSRRGDPGLILRPSSLPGLAVVAVIAAACLPQTLAPLHSSRLGHRQAAAWLAAQASAGTSVLDTRGWTGLFSGHKTYSLPQAKNALGDTRLGYIVLERHELTYDSRRAQTLRELLSRGGTLAARFPGNQPANKAVEVYRWHPQRFAVGP